MYVQDIIHDNTLHKHFRYKKVKQKFIQKLIRSNWRASETLSGVTNGNRRYIYIYMVRARHFSSTGPELHNVGGVKCHLFLKRSNYW